MYSTRPLIAILFPVLVAPEHEMPLYMSIVKRMPTYEPPRIKISTWQWSSGCIVSKKDGKKLKIKESSFLHANGTRGNPTLHAQFQGFQVCQRAHWRARPWAPNGKVRRGCFSARLSRVALELPQIQREVDWQR
jgi:hypothetical protein